MLSIQASGGVPGKFRRSQPRSRPSGWLRWLLLEGSARRVPGPRTKGAASAHQKFIRRESPGRPFGRHGRHQAMEGAFWGLQSSAVNTAEMMIKGARGVRSTGGTAKLQFVS